MTEQLKHVASGAAGSILALIIVAILGWASTGGLIDVLNGVTDDELKSEINKLIQAPGLPRLSGTQTFDTDWIPIGMNCKTEARDIEFDKEYNDSGDFLNMMISAYYKFNYNGQEYIFPWGLNQYGDTLQGNGALLDLDEENRKLYVRLPCDNNKGNHAIHLEKYQNRSDNGIDHFNAGYIQNIQFRVIL